MFFLVYQSVIEEEKFDYVSMSNKISISTFIRKVDAVTKEEAIGKFILDTSKMTFTKRIEPVTCFEFDALTTI